MKIGFTGHRNKIVDQAQLLSLIGEFPSAQWIHGGAVGFDTQVATIAMQHDIDQIVYAPDYAKHGRAAPLIRNRQIVNECNLLVACWDGRKQGGTYYTIGMAKKTGKPIKLLSPI